MESISRSNSSMRYGSALPIGNTSSKAPRTAKSPGSATCGTLRYPAASRRRCSIPKVKGLLQCQHQAGSTNKTARCQAPSMWPRALPTHRAMSWTSGTTRRCAAKRFPDAAGRDREAEFPSRGNAALRCRPTRMRARRMRADPPPAHVRRGYRRSRPPHTGVSAGYASPMAKAIALPCGAFQ